MSSIIVSYTFSLSAEESQGLNIDAKLQDYISILDQNISNVVSNGKVYKTTINVQPNFDTNISLSANGISYIKNLYFKSNQKIKLEYQSNSVNAYSSFIEFGLEDIPSQGREVNIKISNNNSTEAAITLFLIAL